MVTVTCKTNTTAMLWIYNRINQRVFDNNSMLNDQANLGIFTVRLTMIDVDGDNVNLTSLATVSVSSLVDRVTVITCDGNGDGMNAKDALLINGIWQFTKNPADMHKQISACLQPHFIKIMHLM